MAKGKDFYGKDIAEVIEQACKDLGASREELDIEVRETGSAGIFGLCKKKAHIRVQRKAVSPLEEIEAVSPDVAPVDIITIEKTVPIAPVVPVDTSGSGGSGIRDHPQKEAHPTPAGRKKRLSTRRSKRSIQESSTRIFLSNTLPRRVLPPFRPIWIAC
jgi:predicted RNA-binding protein Jag